MRWYVLFSVPSAVVGTYPILPGPVVSDVSLSGLPFARIESKFRDSPSITAGEWYAGGGAGTVICCTECIYLGEG